MQAFDNMQQQLTGMQNATQQDATNFAAQELQKFETAVDAAGNSMHPFYGEVRGVMSDFMKANDSLTIDQAYNAAVQTDPNIASKIQENQQLAYRRQMEQQSSEDAKKARQAGSSLPMSSTNVTVPEQGQTLSLRDELAKNYKDVLGAGQAFV